MLHGIFNQATQALTSVITAPIRLSQRGWKWLGLYILLAGFVFGSILALIIAYQQELRQLVLDYLFPENWHFVANFIIDRFFAAQHKIVLINAAVTGSLILVAVLLFPIKELMSKSFEQDAKLSSRPIEEFPLWFQAWEEIKLFLLFCAVQMTIFWIGYHPSGFRTGLAIFLGYLFLAVSFAIDFLSPVMQRHKARYSQILKVLVRHPIASLVFGLVFSMPPIIVGLVCNAHPNWSMTLILLLGFSANILSIAWAAVCGTWLGAKMLPRLESTPPSKIFTRIIAWLLLSLVLTLNCYAFISVGRSIHHKSQILKCDYSIDLDSFGFKRPSLMALISKKIKAGINFDVIIENPTTVDVEIENNRIEVRHDKSLIATSHLSPTKIEAGTTIKQRVDFTIEIEAASLLKIHRLLDTNWQITLFLEVAEGFDFPVYLLSGR
jgi:hypothetical protein